MWKSVKHCLTISTWPPPMAQAPPTCKNVLFKTQKALVRCPSQALSRILQQNWRNIYRHQGGLNTETSAARTGQALVQECCWPACKKRSHFDCCRWQPLFGLFWNLDWVVVRVRLASVWTFLLAGFFAGLCIGIAFCLEFWPIEGKERLWYVMIWYDVIRYDN